jgi:uncharacterized protein (TIGR02452 family)
MSDTNGPKLPPSLIMTSEQAKAAAEKAARREALKGVAQQTLEILHLGEYVSPSGKVVNIQAAQRAAEEGTVLYPPDASRALLDGTGTVGKPRYEVTDETTQIAAQRLAAEDVVVLNYASAKKPGGRRRRS